MSISAREVAVLVQGLFYLILTESAALQFVRKPGPLRFHVLLILLGAVGSTVLLEISIRLSAAASLETTALMILHLSIASGFLTLYAAFLLTDDLTQWHSWLKWIGVGILILSAVCIGVSSVSFPGSSQVAGMAGLLLPASMFSILFAGFLCISARFWYSSAQASGAIRLRLQWMATSTSLASVGIALTLESLFVPADSHPSVILAHVLLLVAAMVLYLGCVPPGWLRRSWALPELEQASRFCNDLILGAPAPSSGEAAQQRQTSAISQLLQHAMNGFGALLGTVQLWNEARGALEVAASILPSEEGFAADAKSAKDEALAEVFTGRQALLRPICARKWPFLQRRLDSGLVMVAPLKRGEQTLGVIGVCCEHAPNFDQHDLERLQLFADQITCLLSCHLFQEQLVGLQTLRSEQALKDEFIALIAHDLRTPLTVLKGRLQLLRRQMLKDGQLDAAEAVTRLDAPYNRLSQLISTLFDVSYIDTGRLQLLHHTVDLIGLVRKVTSANPEREIILEVEGKPGEEAGRMEPLLVEADAGRLEQVLSSLLDNARKYSPVDSPITVRVEYRAEGAEALLSVRDQGIGIPVEDQPHLFERWFRATKQPTQNYAGLGLGLYISHQIITRHGGRLWVESSGIPGEGSTFFFTLPMFRPQQRRVSADSAAD